MEMRGERRIMGEKEDRGIERREGEMERIGNDAKAQVREREIE